MSANLRKSIASRRRSTRSSSWRLFFEQVALMQVVEVLDGLLETDGDEEADRDGDDVDEKVGPGMSGLVGCVDVDHVGLSVWRCGLPVGVA